MSIKIRRFIRRHRGLVLEGTVLIALAFALVFAVNAEMDFMSGNHSSALKTASRDSNRVVVAGGAGLTVDYGTTGTIRPTPRINSGVYTGP
ncbi:MAG: hypothetical protein P4L76_13515 [Beijerinckiaceae bacterium]|nr:hypothetical protein [Beijerinckiaceae bacterium]